MVFIGAMLFFMGPYALTLELISEGVVKSWILTGFTYAAFALGVFLIYRVVKVWDVEQEGIAPKPVIVSCAVFLMVYITATSFRTLG